jgi:hypothetical protein
LFSTKFKVQEIIPLRRTLTSTVFRAKVISYALGANKVYYRRRFQRYFKKGSYDWKFKELVPFLIVESDLSATSPPLTPTFSSNTSNQNI